SPFPLVDRISFGCAALDSMLDGGIETGCLTLIYGEAGTGKTSLCLLLSCNIVKCGKKVAYIDTEGISLDRLRQIAGADFDLVVKNILFSEVHSFDEQEKMVDKAVKMAEGNPDIGLIVLDSATMYYRLTSRQEERSERRSIANQTVKLLSVARKMNIPVLLTSQVYTDVEKGTYEALGGHALHHNAKVIIRLEKLSPGRRRAVLVKHRHLPEGRTAEFTLTDQGISC
ncbi:MAG: DNA repair and recombination protein RadB, partial [Methanomassiliicoccales archaeon]|nr:DNA repair and recombination protein RadB [Methanomassiliicoccales archaeon]